MSLPYFPMYPTDFEADTSHLTLAEDGAYNRLLRLMWMTPGCSLPDDDAWIKRRMRCTDDEFETVVRIVIDEFCERKNGRVSNARLAKVFLQSDEAHKKRVAAGSKGGKAKVSQTNEKVSSNAKAKPKQPEPEPEPERDTKVSLQEFEKFWSEVPKKVGKGGARKSFAKAVKTATADEIINGMKRHAVAVKGKDPQFIPNPTTWLNEERWTDEVQADTRKWYEKPESEWTKADRDAERMRHL